MTVNIIALIVGPDHPIPIEPLGGTATVTVNDGGPVFYSDTLPVSASSNQGSITAGNSQQFSANSWIISGSYSGVSVLVDTAGLSPILTDATLRTVRGSGKATGDGVTDDAAKIAQQDAAAAASGATLFFPGPATYMMGSSITPTANWLFASGAVLKKTATFTDPQALLVTAAGITIQNLILDGNRPGGATGQGVVWQGSAGVLRSASVKHNKATGIRSTGTGAVLDIYDSESSDNLNANLADGFYAVLGGKIALHGNCVAIGNDRNGAYAPQDAADYCEINGRFELNSYAGVRIRASRVQSQYIEVNDNTNYGVDIDSGASRCRFGRILGRDQGKTAVNPSASLFEAFGSYDVTADHIESRRSAGYGVGLAGNLNSGSTLNGAIDNVVTSIVLTSAANFTAPGIVMIEDEIVTFTGISTNTLTGCVRGAFGSVAASHITLSNALNPFQTVLTGPVTSGATTIAINPSVSNLVLFPSVGVVRLGAEWIIYDGTTSTVVSGKTATTSLLNCTRGAFSSTAAAGSTNDPIMQMTGCRSCNLAEVDCDNTSSWDNDPAVVFTQGSMENTIGHLKAVGTTFAVSFGEQPMPNTNDNNVIGSMEAVRCSFGIVKINRGSNNEIGAIEARDCFNTNTTLAAALLAFDPAANTGGTGVATDNLIGAFRHRTINATAPNGTISQLNGAIRNYIRGNKPLQLWAPAGILETIPRDRVMANLGVALTSGTLHVFGGIEVPGGKTLSNATLVAGTTALATGVNQWFCIIDPTTLKILAVTGDDTSNAWAANAAKTLAFAAAWTPMQDQGVYLGVMVNATTPPTLLGVDMNSQLASIGNANPKRAATSNTSQTVPLAVGTTVSGLTANRVYGYGYVS